MSYFKNRPDAAALGNLVHGVENIFLLVIGVFTIVAMCQEVYTIIMGQTVALKDLLLMFIYVEVLAMVGMYYESKKIPITFPLYIAITALARLVILQGKDQPPLNLLIESGAILILAAACVVLTYQTGKDDPRSPSKDA
jgi:protein PsiE